MEKLINKDQALKATIEYIYKKTKLPSYIKWQNKFGHAVIKTGWNNNYWMWKKNFFLTFQKQFSNYCNSPQGIKGLGESINTCYIKKALQMHCHNIYICYEGKEQIYKICKQYLIDIMTSEYKDLTEQHLQNLSVPCLLSLYCRTHKLIRKQDKKNTYQLNNYSGEYEELNEETYCFPIKLLKRVN